MKKLLISAASIGLPLFLVGSFLWNTQVRVEDTIGEARITQETGVCMVDLTFILQGDIAPDAIQIETITSDLVPGASSLHISSNRDLDGEFVFRAETVDTVYAMNTSGDWEVLRFKLETNAWSGDNPISEASLEMEGGSLYLYKPFPEGTKKVVIYQIDPETRKYRVGFPLSKAVDC